MNDIIEHCPIAYAMNLLGGKWTLPIVWLVNSYPNIRYGQIKKVFPVITNTALSRELKSLEENNILERIDFRESPLRVEYRLTERGKGLMPVIDMLAGFGDELMYEAGKKPYYPKAEKILSKEARK